MTTIRTLMTPAEACEKTFARVSTHPGMNKSKESVMTALLTKKVKGEVALAQLLAAQEKPNKATQGWVEKVKHAQVHKATLARLRAKLATK